MKKLLWLTFALVAVHLTATAASTNVAAKAINSLGIDLLRQTQPNANTVLSPYSIQSAMAMAYEGADATTRTEMAKVLDYPGDDKIRDSLGTLRESLHQIATNSQAQVRRERKESHTKSDPMVLTTANRLFARPATTFVPHFCRC